MRNLLKLGISVCISFSLVYSSNSIAAKSTACPNLEDIKYRSFLNAQHDCAGDFVALQYDIYGTDRAWVFAIDGVKATDVKEALEKAKKLLPTVSGSPEPIDDGQGHLMCQYASADPSVDVLAMTIDETGNTIKKICQRHKKI